MDSIFNNVVEPKPMDLPLGLSKVTVETLTNRMLNNLPAGIDLTEGGFAQDFLKPTAIELERFVHFHLAEFLKLMYPQWSYSIYLEQHALQKKVFRKPANAATGSITIQGEPGVTIPVGSVFAVPGVSNTTEPIYFKTVAEAVIQPGGSVDVDVISTTTGIKTNVPAGSITIMEVPIQGISKITNAEATTGGTEVESDQSLRSRLLDKLASADLEYIGNDADHKRWAEEVPGVGYADIHSLWNGPSTVKINLLDANGEPANEQIIEAVYNHIMAPNDPLQRLAPPGEVLTVRAPELVSFNLAFKITPEIGFELPAIESFIRWKLQEHYKVAKKVGKIIYSEMFAEIVKTPGVADLKDFTVNGQKEVNIDLSSDQYPKTGAFEMGVI